MSLSRTSPLLRLQRLPRYPRESQVQEQPSLEMIYVETMCRRLRYAILTKRILISDEEAHIPFTVSSDDTHHRGHRSKRPCGRARQTLCCVEAVGCCGIA